MLRTSPGLRCHRCDDAEGITLRLEDADDLWQCLDGLLMALGAVHEDDGRMRCHRLVGLTVDVVDEVFRYLIETLAYDCLERTVFIPDSRIERLFLFE